MSKLRVVRMPSMIVAIGLYVLAVTALPAGAARRRSRSTRRNRARWPSWP